MTCKANSIIIRGLLCVFVLYGGMIHDVGAQINDEIFLFDFEQLQLQPPLIENEEIKQAFVPLAGQISQIFRLWDEENFYNKTLLAKLVEFISSNRSDRTALTATLYLASYLSLSLNKFPQDSAIDSAVNQDAKIFYESVTIDFPDTWQGKYASTWVSQHNGQYEAEIEAEIATTKNVLLTFLEIENEPGFITFLEDLGIGEPAGVYLRKQIIYLELKRGNLENAEAELSMIQAQYPDASITKQLEQRIHSVYERQFDGGFSSRPPGELVSLLKNSIDFQKVKYATAGLGNLVIRWGLDSLHDTMREDIHTEMFTYIDRAISGDGAEQEDMIDLIYRLWHLAVPALLETLDHEAPERVAFAGDCLIYMRNEEIITAIIEKAHATEDEDKKAQLIDILSRMNEPCEPVMRFRECLDDTEAEELYQRLVVPALEALQVEEPTPTP